MRANHSISWASRIAKFRKSNTDDVPREASRHREGDNDGGSPFDSRDTQLRRGAPGAQPETSVRNGPSEFAGGAVGAARGNVTSPDVLLSTNDVTVTYNLTKEALHETSLEFRPGECTALIGPSGCGKSTFLRCLNLMNREIPKCRIGGEIWYHGQNINAPGTNVFELRKSIGMVFQQPTPFRKSIRENILFAPKRHGETNKARLDELLETSLRAAALWDEVKDKLDQSALALSGGQQQRLCIARTLAMHPDVILLDEPCSALDPISTFAVEETIHEMVQQNLCVIIVTHNMEQAARVSNNTAFFYLGDMVEWGPTTQLFSAPKTKRLNDYLTGRFG